MNERKGGYTTERQILDLTCCQPCKIISGHRKRQRESKKGGGGEKRQIETERQTERGIERKGGGRGQTGRQKKRVT